MTIRVFIVMDYTLETDEDSASRLLRPPRSDNPPARRCPPGATHHQRSPNFRRGVLHRVTEEAEFAAYREISRDGPFDSSTLGGWA
jgi:hypothetical protein